MDHVWWMVAIGGACAFLHSVVMGKSDACPVSSLQSCHLYLAGTASKLASETQASIKVSAGAAMPAQCWGPLIGAKVIQYRTAVLVGVVFQAAGMLAFGPETYTIFSGLLSNWHVLQPYPRATLYTLMWIQVTPIIWHSLSIWRRMLLPGYLATSMLLHSA